MEKSDKDKSFYKIYLYSTQTMLYNKVSFKIYKKHTPILF